MEQYTKRLPDGEELVVEGEDQPADLRSPDADPRASSLDRRRAAVTGRLDDQKPRSVQAPRVSAER
jgi:hypothetical protein